MSSLGLGRWGKRGKYPSLKTERISKTFTRQHPAVLAVRLDGVQLGRGVSHLLSGLPAVQCGKFSCKEERLPLCAG